MTSKFGIKKYELFMMLAVIANIIIFTSLSHRLENYIDGYLSHTDQDLYASLN